MNMTPEFKQFLTEFAELLKKHGVEIEATESEGYERYCDGIEFWQNAEWDGEKGIIIRPGTCFKHNSKLLDYKDIEDIIAKS